MRVKKKTACICITGAVLLAILSLGCGAFGSDDQRTTAKSFDFLKLARRAAAGSAGYMILIDPGHGGMDGGTSGTDGTLEKDINLAISKKLAAAADKYDCGAMMTRETDQWLCDTDEGSIRSRKTADLRARREMIRQYSPDVTVSIHLNSFTEDPSVNGAQVFYPGSGGDEQDLQQCRELAEILQDSLNETLQQERPRTAMVRDGVFIFKEVEHPVVIIECGFLSNHEEAQMLKSDEYQEQLAACIMAGIAEFANLQPHEELQITDSLHALQSLEISGFIDSFR